MFGLFRVSLSLVQFGSTTVNLGIKAFKGGVN